MVGGKSAPASVNGVVAHSVVVACLLAACGGRTATWDPELYGDAKTTGGVASGGSSGSSKSGGGGVTTPRGGNGGAQQPSDSLQTCESYCKAAVSTCSNEFRNEQDCISACVNELGRTSAACQATGIAALRCLTPHFAAANLRCDVAEADALSACRQQVDAFARCSGAVPEPQPTEPAPEPGSGASCSSSANVGPGYCTATYTCSGRLYTVECSVAGNVETCTCDWLAGSAGTLAFPEQPNACYNAAKACGLSSLL